MIIKFKFFCTNLKIFFILNFYTLLKKFVLILSQTVFCPYTLYLFGCIHWTPMMPLQPNFVRVKSIITERLWLVLTHWYLKHSYGTFRETCFIIIEYSYLFLVYIFFALTFSLNEYIYRVYIFIYICIYTYIFIF